MKQPLSIKFKLTLWYLFFLAITLVFFGGVSYFILEQNLYHTSQDTLNTTVFNVQNPAADADRLTQDQSYRSLLVYNMDKDQLQKINSENTAPLSVSIPQGTITLDQKAFIRPEMDSEQEIWLYYRPSSTQPGSFEILAMTQSKSTMLDLISAFHIILAVAIPATLVLAACLGYLLAKRMLRPVADITKIAQDIHDKDLNRRIEVKNNDELGRLSLTLNQTFERLQKSLERQRQFTSDASHEIQTPLAIVQGEATLALSQERTAEEYQKALESISEETSRIFSTVSKLLMLARADSGKETLDLADVNLKRFLRDIAEDVGVLSEKKQINFLADLKPDLTVKGDELKLRELFLNLLGNAIKFTPSGGNILLSLAKQDGMAKIMVKDTGIGIPAEHVPHIFERFYRVNKTHSDGDEGSGLGLTISQYIAEIHGGKIEVESKVGEGSVFIVTLPLTIT